MNFFLQNKKKTMIEEMGRTCKSETKSLIELVVSVEKIREGI